MANRTIQPGGSYSRDLRKLIKKHSELERELEATLAQIATSDANPPPGDRIPNVGGHRVYKLRIPYGNRGKSRGARLIYYCAEALVMPLFIYVKGDTENLPADVIRGALKDAELWPDELE